MLRIKKVMKEKGVSGKELAEMIGVSEAAMSAIASGKSSPRANTLFKIAQSLQVRVDELFTDSSLDKEVSLSSIDKKLDLIISLTSR